MRLYKRSRDPAVLGSAQAIMAFEMEGWQANPQLPCPGGIPFSNNSENTDRNTITNAPAAELAVQLYKATGNAQYLHGFVDEFGASQVKFVSTVRPERISSPMVMISICIAGMVDIGAASR